MDARSGVRGQVAAVLGPTNTGKTHLAVERMLGHASGIIGLPLRLLAREVYERAVAQRGKHAVALVTGEEKIVPAEPRYWVCTTESMPLGLPVEFVAVDEIQLMADPERGHVFTDRVLHARGRQETMFLGAETIRPVLRKLVPEAVFESRPRFSALHHAGHRKLSRIGPRSAVVAFSAEDVYALAELVRRHRGGAAVVLGALSPRTRNAQVAMFEAGEVDFLVATDAIGMGLNLNLQHVAFAALRKFDGFRPRNLSPAEIAQVAGRAGRHLSDGTFGTTTGCPEIDAETVERLETHKFEPVRAAYWRNSDIEMGSADALLASLEAPPPELWRRLLVRPRRATDQAAFAALAEDRRPQGRAAVGLLWDVCQIPDYRKTMTESHTRLLGRIYDFLAAPGAVLPTDWMADHIARLDRTDGDIDALAARIAYVRTWTYVSHHADWVRGADHWQQRTREVEDRLSDALHERLTQRFVDRRSAALTRGLGGARALDGVVAQDGEVEVEGHAIGYLRGFRFVADAAGAGTELRLLRTAAQHALRREIRVRAAALVGEPDAAFTLDGADVHWRGEVVARLAAGPTPRTPRILLLADDLLEGNVRRRIERRLENWLAMYLRRALAPLLALEAPGLTGTARGIAYQLAEGMGAVPRANLRDLAEALTTADRRALGRRGVRLGAVTIFLPAMLKRGRPALGGLLWALGRGARLGTGLPPGAVSVAADPDLPVGFYGASGYRLFGSRAVRVDQVERLWLAIRRLARTGPVPAAPELERIAGCKGAAFAEVLLGLGFAAVRTPEGTAFAPVRARSRAQKPSPDGRVREHSPFAALARHPARRR